ncbi:hypothetical protein C2E21_7007 [Chlorella sorokiniana]|uniref:Uncharacterized protein n=1 Tax=Chlorella sorokiniana TaxID=3076 RepID=A0A2P6TJD0_CHLSO|nr:hypothetical protein C2E21_7007 [Chlorella sorokiniana]|eukprot:PRW39339.1 hypothetical protein C2E21_7007 [Chlorella sorokiniana]
MAALDGCASCSDVLQMVLAADAADVSNMLLALGTLAESDSQLAAVVSQHATTQLLQHAVALAGRGELAPLQPIANTFYGAALLGLQPSAVQVQQLFSAVQHALEQPPGPGDCMNVTQVLLACAELSDVQVPAGGNLTPDANPFLRYYPGARLVDALLHRATCAPLGEQAASHTVNACGRLLHVPSAEDWAALLAAIPRHANGLSPVAASALLVSLPQC